MIRDCSKIITYVCEYTSLHQTVFHVNGCVEYCADVEQAYNNAQS